jgi:predicted metal-binding protein
MNSSSETEKTIQEIFRTKEITDFKLIDPKSILVAQWVRMKCMFGCPDYGKGASCPPNVPSISECRQFFDEYGLAAVLRFEKKFDNPDDRHDWTKGINLKLLEIEKQVFLSGYVKAFLLFVSSCELCEECTAIRSDCKHPKRARPTPEAMGVDVFTTVREIGYPIEVLKDPSDTMNRYALLMIE